MTGFRATGKGLSNQTPDFPADERTGSAKLFDSNTGRSLYLFVTNVSTSWSLQGSASQTQSRRTFYPQHLVQADVVVKGQCANQYEYDRLVEFVERHQHGMLGLSRGTGVSPIFSSGISSAAFAKDGPEPTHIGVDFMLLPSVYGTHWAPPIGGVVDKDGVPIPSAKGIYKLPQFYVAGIITQIRAGATKFKFSPEFEFGLKVTRDYNGGLYDDVRDVQKAMGSYQAGLGTMYTAQEQLNGGGADSVDWGALDPIIDDAAEAIEAGAEWLEEAVNDVVEGITDIIPGGD